MNRTTERPALFIAAMSMASGAVWLSMGDVAILIPTLQEDLGASFTQMQWIASVAFTLTITPLLVPAGRLTDRLGPKRIVLAGLAVFAAFSVAAIVAEVWMMTLARAGQGVGAALVVAASLSGLATDLPEARRGLGVAIWGTTAAVLQGLGPTFGGLMASAGVWQGVFLVNVPVALVVWWALSRSAVDVGMRRGRLGDRSGTLLLTGWTVAVTVALVQGPTWGWRSPATLVALALGVVMLVGFVVVEFRSTSPLLDLRLFASRGLSGSVLLNFSNNAVFVAFTFLMSLYLQVALGYSAMEAGAFFVAASGAALLVGPFTDRLVLRLGLAAVGVGAAVLTAGGLLAVTALSPGVGACGDRGVRASRLRCGHAGQLGCDRHVGLRGGRGGGGGFRRVQHGRDAGIQPGSGRRLTGVRGHRDVSLHRCHRADRHRRGWCSGHGDRLPGHR